MVLKMVAHRHDEGEWGEFVALARACGTSAGKLLRRFVAVQIPVLRAEVEKRAKAKETSGV